MTPTDIDETDPLCLRDELQRLLHVLHPLRVHARLLVVAADLLLREDLQQYDKAHAVAQVLGQVVDEHLLDLQVLVAPSRERLLLDSLPLRIQVLVSTRGHVYPVPVGASSQEVS